MEFEQDVYDVLARNYALHQSIENLRNVRNYLDDTGFHMPKPRFHYLEDDITTHKFLNGQVTFNEKRNKFTYKNVYNPNFKYGLLV